MAQNYDLEDLLRIALRDLSPLGVEQVPLSQALGRTLAWDVTALRDRPALPISAVNGFAVRTADLSGARRHHPALLTLSDQMAPGLAVPVYAGEPLPPGCDAVIPRSDTDCGAPRLSVFHELWPYDNYIRPGADYRAGTLLLPAETVLDAAALCLLSSSGYETAPLRVRPRVKVVPGSGARRESALFLTTLLKDWGADMDGGESAHFFILLGPSTAMVGARPICSLNSSPCGVLALSHLNGTPVLTLSEDPVELFKAAALLVRPMLAYLTNSHALLPTPVPAQLGTSFQKASPTRRFLTGHFSNGWVTLPETSPLLELPSANCLVDLPGGTPPLDFGARIKVLLL